MESIRLSEGAEWTTGLTLTRRAIPIRCWEKPAAQEIDGEEHLFELMEELVHGQAGIRPGGRTRWTACAAPDTAWFRPAMEELTLEEAGAGDARARRFGVRLKASAPSLHMIRVDIRDRGQPHRRHGKAVRGAGAVPAQRL